MERAVRAVVVACLVASLLALAGTAHADPADAGAAEQQLAERYAPVLRLVAQAPFVVVNLIPGVVQALLAPFTSLMVGLIYYAGLARDDRVNEQPDGAAPPGAEDRTSIG